MRALALLLVGACASSVAPRFRNAPVVATLDDRRDTPTQPKVRDFLPNLWWFRASLIRVATHPLSLPRPQRARGVNALDEAPNSTWFTNRGPLTPAQVERGPLTHDATPPFTITSTKSGGTVPGFVVEDAAKVKYLLKFDESSSPPEIETATHVICNRLMWALGYNVAEDAITAITPADLKIGAKAKLKDVNGETVGALQQKDVDAVLAHVHHQADGKIRVLASRWIEGKTIGGHPVEGVRDDDPNDRIPHEHRRDLRGMQAIDAWMDAVDVTEGQFVDSWVEDHGKHYVLHYAIDFGKSLGAMGAINHDWWRGYAYRIDFPAAAYNFITFGLNDRWWEHRDGPRNWAAVSELFTADSVQPGDWHSDTPGYTPFREADRFDMFWGTKLLGRLTREQISAAVSAGKIADPNAAKYLVDTLIARQRKMMAYWFERVAPLDRFAIGPKDLCWVDLGVEAGLASPQQYAIESFDFEGKPIGHATATSGANGWTCAGNLPVAPSHDGYAIHRIDGETDIHVARDAAGAPRIIGIYRR